MRQYGGFFGGERARGMRDGTYGGEIRRGTFQEKRPAVGKTPYWVCVRRLPYGGWNCKGFRRGRTVGWCRSALNLGFRCDSCGGLKAAASA